MSAAAFTHQFKILTVGDSGVGKSSILHRFSNDAFSPNFLPTIGIDYKMKNISIESMDSNGKKYPHIVRLSLWDTAGQERFLTITKQYFRGAHGMLLIYDSTDRCSFENIHRWISQIEQSAERGTVIFLIANKCDQLNQAVSEEEGLSLADEYGLRFFKTSAKANINIIPIFTEMAKDVHRNLKLRDSYRVDTHHPTEKPIVLNDPARYVPPQSTNSCCSGGMVVSS